MHHRPPPTLRSAASSLAPSPAPSPSASPRLSPLLPPASFNFSDKFVNELPSPTPPPPPSICGLPLKYVSLVTLAVQNAALAIVMHYSRISTPPELSYSPAAAVLLNEILKGSISLVVAIYTAAFSSPSDYPRYNIPQSPFSKLSSALCSVLSDIFSPDCWKLSIPAILYVVQNSLQFVAISNLPVATFQVTYQMKILTTAAFSVALLRRRLTTTKWLSLFFLAIGVGIVQIQSSTSNHSSSSSGGGASSGSGSGSGPDTPVGSAHEFSVHVMNPFKGFCAVTAACFTSGLAGVYFEMVLKGSKADLWVRNVQLSLFSLIPALLPILLYAHPHSATGHSNGFISDLFKNFGAWAWATVATQVFGGLVTAVVIKYSDNILKGFATSLSIVLSFLASVVLFDFSITWSFVIGASTVLTATWMYNQPPGKEPIAIVLTGTSVSGNGSMTMNGGGGGGGGMSSSSGKSTPFPGTPISSDMPILGEYDGINGISGGGIKRKKAKASPFASSLGLAAAAGEKEKSNTSPTTFGFSETLDTTRYHNAPYGSPWPSRPPSRVSTPMPMLEHCGEGEA